MDDSYHNDDDIDHNDSENAKKKPLLPPALSNTRFLS